MLYWPLRASHHEKKRTPPLNRISHSDDITMNILIAYLNRGLSKLSNNIGLHPNLSLVFLLFGGELEVNDVKTSHFGSSRTENALLEKEREQEKSNTAFKSHLTFG